MKLKELREEVWQANLKLFEYRLAPLTWGNASGFAKEEGIVAIKPSGVPYSELKISDIVLVDLEGKVVESHLRPSSDTPTHLEIYRAFPEVGGVCHTHSTYATIFAQAEVEIPCLGTTHADYFFGPIPLARHLTAEEIAENYEKNTGKIIVEKLKGKEIMACPAILLPGHGVFTWGESAFKAVDHALVVEEIARIAFGTLLLSPRKEPISEELLFKHFYRRHGQKAYYGQTKGGNHD
ncbi:MAG: L-ribulose-5-phosphate 4-epimerase AraD [Candidatus Aminicenantes bacterium]|nr:L-ribulose-5-phosphate 4-epimerase AraD [Candidatus Aminicenantes bacterium]